MYNALVLSRTTREIGMFRTHVFFLAACACATAAQATSVTVLQGEALLRRGEGYESVKGVADLSPGDTVVAKAGSSVKVTFSNGCTVFLGMGMVFSVPAEPPCDGSGSASEATGTLPNTAAPPAQDWSAATQTTVAPAETQTNVLPYLLGAAAVGGISAAAVAYAGGGGGGGTPASP